MAFATLVYGSKGPTDTMAVSFPYISEDDVEVYVDDVLIATDKYEFTSPTLITCLTGFTEGDKTVVRRKSIPTTPPAVFTSPVFQYAFANLNATTLLYSIQENMDRDTEFPALRIDPITDDYEAGGVDIGGLATPTADDHAARKKYVDDTIATEVAAVTAAVATYAQTASDAADAASTDADDAATALSAAQIAQGLAEDAQTAAEAAQAAAEAAALAAEGIESVVEDLTPQLGGDLDANGFDIDMGVNEITDTKVGQWDTAFGWGNHASAGYIAPTITSIASGELLKWNGSAWINNTLAEAGIAAASHTHATSAITSGTFADARIAASNVTQHQASLSLATSQITSGTMADARIAESNVTQHEDALTLDSSQLANLTISTSDPSGGTNGDLWFKREA